MFKRLFCSLLVSLLIAGCTHNARSFAGFTFGGGGHTYSAEPAILTLGPDEFRLQAGDVGDEVYLELSWPAESSSREEAGLSTALVTVKAKGSGELEAGHVVLQAEKGPVAHGSFDFTVKTEDGRQLRVVGSFTATKE